MAQARGLAAVWVRGDAGLTLTVVVEIEWGGGGNSRVTEEAGLGEHRE